MRKIYYLRYVIFETLIEQLIPTNNKTKIYIVQIDMSEHSSLAKAKFHIDYLTK